MNIKSKLTLRFLIMVSSIWLVASATIYISSSNYRKEEFYRRLEARSITAAKLLIEFEEVDAALLLKIESANPIKLPDEKISIYNYDNEEIFTTDLSSTIPVTDDLLDKIRLEKQHSWTQGEVELLGMLYTEQLDRFVIISAAQDVFGKSKLVNLRNILLIVFICSIIIVFFLGRIYAQNALQPISKVIDQVNAISASSIDKRISEGNGTDEIAVLGITFNKMLNRLEEGFKSQRSFIANASHELRTPLAAILSQIDVTNLKTRTPAEYEKTLESIKEDVKNLSALSDKLLLLARTDSFNESFTPIRIDAILWSLQSEINKLNPDYKIKIKIDPAIDDEQQLIIRGNEQMLKVAFANFIDNSCKFSNDHTSEIHLSFSKSTLHLTFKDHGYGIPKEELSVIFQPFNRASNVISIKGHGIGLSLAKRIIELHNGHFSLQSDLNKGTLVTIELPLNKF